MRTLFLRRASGSGLDNGASAPLPYPQSVIGKALAFVGRAAKFSGHDMVEKLLSHDHPGWLKLAVGHLVTSIFIFKAERLANGVPRLLVTRHDAGNLFAGEAVSCFALRTGELKRFKIQSGNRDLIFLPALAGNANEDAARVRHVPFFPSLRCCSTTVAEAGRATSAAGGGLAA